MQCRLTNEDNAIKRGANHGNERMQVTRLIALVALAVGMTASVCAQAPRQTPAQAERVHLPILDQAVERIPWKTAQKDFFFRLPEHVRFVQGSALSLVLRASPELLQEVCSLAVEVNHRTLFTGGPGEPLISAPNDPTIRFALPVDASILAANWNRVSVRFILRKSSGAETDLNESASWEVNSTDSFFALAYERRPLFPELRRFPYSLTEEQLLRQRMTPLDPANPAVALLLPEERRDVHMRSIAVLGACLGRATYFNECRLGSLSSFALEVRERNGIVVGRRDELSMVEIPPALRDTLDALGSGQGLIAEVIFGTFPAQSRWIILSGIDDVGLEKALMTLSHEPALLQAAPNPAVINAFPDVTPAMEEKSRPGPATLRLGQPEMPELTFRGIYNSQQSIFHWRLPPGYATGPGTLLRLKFAHSAELIEPRSRFEVLVNGVPAGAVPLTAQTASGGTEEMVLPVGLRGFEPMTLTFRAHLELNAVNCDPLPTDRAWLVISGDSTLESNPVRESISNLSQVQAVLNQDAFMRQTAFLVPADATIEELQWLLDLNLRLGHDLSASSVLWPEVCAYNERTQPPAGRLEGRNILMLGSVSQLEHSLPKTSRILVRMNGGYARDVYLQGRKYPLSRFEPTLAMMSQFPSQWSTNHMLIAAGGWQTFAVPALARMLTDPESAGHIYGEFSAMDANGRAAAYDPNVTQPESLAECLFRKIPAGLTPEQTILQRFEEESRLRRSTRINFAVFVWTGAILFLLIACRIWLLWEQSRVHRQHRRQALPAPRAP